MKGVIILNTGSPKTQSREDVKFFIGAMLSDPLVLSTVPNWFRNTLAKRIIAPLRASNSASHYKLIWDNEHNESPLIYNSLQLAKKIEETTGMPTEIAMRYGNPSIDDAFDRLKNKCTSLHEVIIVPMFPQYAQSSYQTAVDEVARCFMSKPQPFRIKFIEPFYNEPEYISALATSITPFIENGYDKLIFSFHSLPIPQVEIGFNKGKGFDYVYQLKETVRLVTKELGVDPKKNRIVYSSAIGKNWLKPDLEETMKDLAKSGIQKVVALTAGFPADNLESLYDIDIVAREAFERNGGTDFNFVPGLNAQFFWVEGLIKIIARKN